LGSDRALGTTNGVLRERVAKKPHVRTPDRPQRSRTPDRPQRSRTPDRPQRSRTTDRPQRSQTPDRPQRSRTPDCPQRSRTRVKKPVPVRAPRCSALIDFGPPFPASGLLCVQVFVKRQVPPSTTILQPRFPASRPRSVRVYVTCQALANTLKPRFGSTSCTGAVWREFVRYSQFLPFDDYPYSSPL